MTASRRALRIALLAVIGLSLTACHFHRHGCGGFHHRAPIRICR